MVILLLISQDRDNDLWFKYYQDGWSGWYNLGGTVTLTSSPSEVFSVSVE
jgi:hypothetical protein